MNIGFGIKSESVGVKLKRYCTQYRLLFVLIAAANDFLPSTVTYVLLISSGKNVIISIS